LRRKRLFLHFLGRIRPFTLQFHSRALGNIADSFITEWMSLHQNCPTLWHYTNARGLLGILQNNELWFTDASFLNDASEMSYAVELTKRIVDKGLEDSGISPTVKEYLESFLRSIISHRDNIREYAFVNPTFVCCFCEEADSLHLWRAYSDHGRGYSIGLYPDHIINKLRPIRLSERAIHNDKLVETWHHFRPFLSRVIYNEEGQERIINRLLDLLVQAINAAPSEFPSGNVNNIHKMIATSRLFRLFYLCLFCFKHPTFKDEREWRLIYAPDFSKSEASIESIPISELHYRASGHYFVPYLKVDVAKEAEVEYQNQKVKMKALEFETIIAGPGLDARLARASFNAYALRNGYLGSNVGVEQSIVPLRSL
jgi:hypothetical protein